jgi:predicted PurR-regulated permease PerM
MVGTIWWNVIAGFLSFVSTFLMSARDNLLVTSLLKGTYSFAIIFALMFVVRFVFGLVLHQSQQSTQLPEKTNESAEQTGLGQHLDLITPNDSSDNNTFKPMSFTPHAPKFDKMKVEEMDTEALVRAVRHLTGDGDEGR